MNAQIRSNESVTTRLMTPDEAIAAGAMALFGEKYGDEVRVLSMGSLDDDIIRSSYAAALTFARWAISSCSKLLPKARCQPAFAALRR